MSNALENDDYKTQKFKLYVLKRCGNCDFRYSGFCQNPKGRVKRPRIDTKACDEFTIWGRK